MSRIAEGTLRLNVEDGGLEAHIQRLREVKAAWKDLKEGADALKDAVPQKFINSIEMLNETLRGEAGGLLEFAKGSETLAKALSKLPQRVGALNTELNKLAVTMAGMTGDVVKVSGALQKVADVIKTDLSGTSLSRSASGVKGLAKSMGHLATSTDAAAVTTRSLTVAWREANAVGVPLQHTQDALGTSLDKTTRKAQVQASSLKKLQQDFIRLGASLFIAYHWVKGAVKLFEDSAQQVDLRNTLTLSMENFVETMKEAREATAGTVSELEMMKSAALMSSFGLPMGQFAEQMGMVQKMAIRTGQSTEYLMESLARGVSRQSPLILDNLGLQISLTKAYETYAATLGKAASALTDMEKKEAVMAEVMRQSAQLTKDVDIGASKAAQLQRLQANLLNDLRSVGEEVVSMVARAFQKSDQAASDLLQTVRLLKKEMGDTGAATAQMSEIDFIQMTRPGEMGKITALVGKGLELLGIYERTISLNSEQLDLMEREAKQAKARADVSLTLSRMENQLAREAADPGGGVEGHLRARIEQATLALLRHQGMQHAENLRMAHEMGLITTENYEAARKQNADVIEQEILKLDKYQQSAKMQAVLNDFARNRERLKAVEESIAAETLYRDELQKNIELATFQSMQKEAIKKQTAALEAMGKDIIFNDERRKELLIDHNALMQAAHSVALLQYNVSRAMHADAIASLDKQNKHIIRQQLSANNMLAVQYEHDLVQKKLNEKLAEYNKMRANSITYATGEMKFSDEQIKARGEEVAQLQRKSALLKEQAKYQELGLKAAHDVTMLSKEQRQQEAYLLAGKKTRLQVEKLLIEAREIVITYERQIADILKAQNLMRAAGLTFMVDVMEGKLEEAQAKMAAAAEKAGKLYEDLKRFPMPSLGGGGGREKIEKETKETIAVFRNTILNQEDSIDDVGRKTANVLFRAFKQETKTVFDAEGNLISTDVGKAFQRDLMGSFAIDDQTIWSGAGTFQIRSRAALVELKKFAGEVLEFQKAALEEGALTPAQDAYLNTLHNRLEAERAIAEERVKLLDEWSSHAQSVETALRNAFSFAGDAQFFGREMMAVLDNLTNGFARFAEVLKQEELNTYDLFAAAMPVMRSAYQAFEKDKRKRAGIEAVMQAAAAWAAWPNVPKVITHSTAALMYAGIAGGAIKLPSQTGSSAAKEEKLSEARGPLHIHLYGDSIATEGERGRYLEQIMAEARAEGYT